MTFTELRVQSFEYITSKFEHIIREDMLGKLYCGAKYRIVISEEWREDNKNGCCSIHVNANKNVNEMYSFTITFYTTMIYENSRNKCSYGEALEKVLLHELRHLAQYIEIINYFHDAWEMNKFNNWHNTVDYYSDPMEMDAYDFQEYASVDQFEKGVEFMFKGIEKVLNELFNA